MAWANFSFYFFLPPSSWFCFLVLFAFWQGHVSNHSFLKVPASEVQPVFVILIFLQQIANVALISAFLSSPTDLALTLPMQGNISAWNTVFTRFPDCPCSLLTDLALPSACAEEASLLRHSVPDGNSSECIWPFCQRGSQCRE